MFMRKQIIALNVLLLALVVFIGVISCKKSSNTTVTFGLSSIKAGTIDLNGATPPANIPPNATITAIFSIAVNPSTVTTSNIKLLRGYDTVYAAINVTVSGGTITIVPVNDLGNGTSYQLSFTGLIATDGQGLAPFTRAFATIGTFVPSGVIAYYNFEGNANDQVGTWNPSPTGIVDLTYGTSYSTAAGQCASFNGTTTIIEIPNGDQLDNTTDFTVSFWVKAISAGHVDSSGNPKGQFVFGLGAFLGFEFEITGDYTSCKLAASYRLANDSTESQDLWFAGDGNLGWQGWTYCRDLTSTGGVPALLKDNWALVHCIYNSVTKIGTMYINGQIMKSQDFNLWPNGDPMTGVKGLKYGGVTPDVYPILALGFIYSRNSHHWPDEWATYSSRYANHFGGLLDDLRFFHRALTANEVALMYASEKP
jgi:hypothetical protein